MVVDELKSRITYTEFIEWVVFLDEEEDRTSILHHYLAQIAAEVRRGYVKNPAKVKTQDFILKREKKKKRTPQEQAEYSKNVWFAALNIDPNKKKKGK